MTGTTRESAPEPVAIDYTNHRGRRARRLILPLKIWFGVSDWHPTPQWFLRAFDLDKHQTRDFAMTMIHTLSIGLPATTAAASARRRKEDVG